MSKHKSYGRAKSGGGNRSVLTRWERIVVLRKARKWVDGVNKKVTGLPKTQPR